MEFNATFLVTIISFLVFVFLMNKILYAPVLNIMEERRNFVDGNYESAQENDKKAEALANEKEAMLTNTRNCARGKYLETVEGFKAKKSDTIRSAQDSARDELDSEREKLESLSNDVKNGLKNSMNDLANDIVEKVIGYRSELQNFDDEAVNKALWG